MASKTAILIIINIIIILLFVIISCLIYFYLKLRKKKNETELAEEEEESEGADSDLQRVIVEKTPLGTQAYQIACHGKEESLLVCKLGEWVESPISSLPPGATSITA